MINLFAIFAISIFVGIVGTRMYMLEPIEVLIVSMVCNTGYVLWGWDWDD